jgi:hypothetical protein
MNLFKQKPTIHFYPQVSDGDLKVLKSREKNVVTLDIGPFCANETILQDAGGSVYHSEQLQALTDVPMDTMCWLTLDTRCLSTAAMSNK